MQVILQESLVAMSRHPAIVNKQVKTPRIMVNNLNTRFCINQNLNQIVVSTDLDSQQSS